MRNNVPKWTWETVTPDRSVSSGDITKIFRNEDLKHPGVFASNPPPPSASLMAREIIQNSWDAALEAHEELVNQQETCLDFEIHFDYRTVSGDEKHRLVAALGLQDLALHMHNYLSEVQKNPEMHGGVQTLGLPNDTCLPSLESDSSSLEYLVISEVGTTGMYGRWGPESRMYQALAAVGYTFKNTGGGSFGFGKSGLIAGSSTRTVIAYTCFRDRPDDPNISRRLFGMTYWGHHTLCGEHYPGFARYGKRDAQDRVEPYNNESADELAELLGIDKRNPEDCRGLGTQGKRKVGFRAVRPPGSRVGARCGHATARWTRPFRVSVESCSTCSGRPVAGWP